MRRLKWLILICGLMASHPLFAADEGKSAPEFEATLFGGDKFTLSKVSGQVSILHFWASWCEPCQVEMPIFNTYYIAHRSEGLRLIAISMDSEKDFRKAREIMKKFSFDAALSKDARFKAYGRIWRLPLTFVVDRSGILQKDGWVLKHTLTREDLEGVVTPLLKARPLNQTK